MKIILKSVDTPHENIDKIDVLVGIMSGKMYIPEKEELKNEGFVLVAPYKIETGQTPEEVKEHWDNKGEIRFLD